MVDAPAEGPLKPVPPVTAEPMGANTPPVIDGTGSLFQKPIRPEPVLPVSSPVKIDVKGSSPPSAELAPFPSDLSEVEIPARPMESSPSAVEIGQIGVPQPESAVIPTGSRAAEPVSSLPEFGLPRTEVSITQEEKEQFIKEAKAIVKEIMDTPFGREIVEEMKKADPQLFPYHNFETHVLPAAENGVLLAVIEQKKFNKPISEVHKRVQAVTMLLHDLKFKDVPFGLKGKDHEKLSADAAEEILRRYRISEGTIKLVRGLIRSTQLMPVDMTLPTEDWVLKPVDARTVYNDEGLGTLTGQEAIDFSLFEELVNITRDADLSNLGEPNAIENTRRVYFDENRAAEGKPGFQKDHYRDFTYRILYGLYDANPWHTEAAQFLWDAQRTQNRHELVGEVERFNNESMAKAEKMRQKISLEKPS